MCCTHNSEYSDDVAKLNLNEVEPLKRGCGQFTKNIAFICVTTPDMPTLTPEFEPPTNGDDSPITPVMWTTFDQCLLHLDISLWS